MSYQTLLYYKYVDLPEVESIYNSQFALSKSLGLKGRILLAKEGINGTCEGTQEACQRYIEETKKIPELSDMIFKISTSDGDNFPKLSIKIRDEIVSTHVDDKDNLGPHRGVTGKYLTSEELHEWIKRDKEFYIIDMRNDYEHAVGHFEGSIMPSFQNFRDLPNILPEIEHLKNKTVVTVCTGGVRCEKASGFLLKHGFTDVYQLYNGIVDYMNKYPNQDFLGKLYVFDRRVIMGFNTDSADHKVVGKCCLCGATSENLIDFYKDGKRNYNVVCEECIAKDLVVAD
jgi:UPF0176 protein